MPATNRLSSSRVRGPWTQDLKGLKGSQKSDQSLARISSFLGHISIIPSPSRFLGKVTVLHLTMWSFLFSCIDPHRKSLFDFSTASRTFNRKSTTLHIVLHNRSSGRTNKNSLDICCELSLLNLRLKCLLKH